MANTKQAKKRARQSEAHRQHNASMRSMLRTCIKNVVKAIEAKDHANAVKTYAVAVRVLDRMTGKGIIHKNKASRHKERLNAHIKALGAKKAA